MLNHPTRFGYEKHYLLVLEAMTPAPPVEALWRRLCRLVVGPPRAVACRSASVAVHLSSCANSWHNSIFKYSELHWILGFGFATLFFAIAGYKFAN